MRKPILLLLAVSLLFACNRFDEFENVDDVRYDADFAIPLIDTRLSIRDMLENFEENSTLVVDPDGLLRFIYRGDVITKTSDDIFAEINATLEQYPLIPVLSTRQALPFSNPDGLDIDLLTMKGGSLGYFFRNPHQESLDVTIRFPQVKKDGEPIVIEKTIQAWDGTGDMPFMTNALLPIQLADYIIEPENDSIYIEYEALRPNGDPDTLSSFIITIQDFEFQYAEGYLGNELHEGGRDTIYIDFFDNWVRGEVYFENPTVTFNFENSFGIPTRSIVNRFQVLTVRQDTLKLRSAFVDNGIDFPYPALDEVGAVKNEEFVFSKENSNIDSILGAGPIAVDYDVDAITNPDGNTDIRGFITCESYYNVQVEIELPLYGHADNFIALDTFELDFENYDNVEHAEFKLVADNGLPLSVDVQAYFLDENGTVLDSVLDDRQRLVSAAPVDAEGFVTQPNTQVTFAPFTEERFANIKTAKKIAVNASFSTFNEGDVSVKILSDQQVDIRMGVILGVRE